MPWYYIVGFVILGIGIEWVLMRGAYDIGRNKGYLEGKNRQNSRWSWIIGKILTEDQKKIYAYELAKVGYKILTENQKKIYAYELTKTGYIREDQALK